MKNAVPQVPGHLSPEAQARWLEISSDWELEPPAQMLLLSALESLDRMREAQAAILKDGAYGVDRFGQTKAHPALQVERDAKAAMARDLGKLNLDLEPLKDVGRPPRGNR